MHEFNDLDMYTFKRLKLWNSNVKWNMRGSSMPRTINLRPPTSLRCI